ncbi:22535_t:CDS:1, partial [Gigaspora margarita]
EKWDSFHQAIEYTKDPKAKKHERIFFITLYDASKTKKAEGPHQQIFLEECMPTKDQIKKNKGIKTTEPNNYSTIYDS